MPKKLDPTNAARQRAYRARHMMVPRPMLVEPQAESKERDSDMARLISMLDPDSFPHRSEDDENRDS